MLAALLTNLGGLDTHDGEPRKYPEPDYSDVAKSRSRRQAIAAIVERLGSIPAAVVAFRAELPEIVHKTDSANPLPVDLNALLASVRALQVVERLYVDFLEDEDIITAVASEIL